MTYGEKFNELTLKCNFKRLRKYIDENGGHFE